MQKCNSLACIKIALLSIIFLLSVACAPLLSLSPRESLPPTLSPQREEKGTATPLLTLPTAPTLPPQPLPQRFTTTPRRLAVPTATSTPTPTPTWSQQGPGEVIVPILLYHHIQESEFPSRYRIPPEKFEQQIKLLHDWGYTTISTELLVQAITLGAQLPPHPIIITFDDGDIDVYQNAFPIMEKYGFTGVFYLVSNYIGQPNYITAEQVQEMAAAGWEIGSHSLSHLDLIKNPERQRDEIVQSKEQLETMLGVPVRTFAYPFGRAGQAARDYVKFAQYIAAMGLGYTPVQSQKNLYYLWRWEVQGTFDLQALIDYLPWKGDPDVIPTDKAPQTATPTASP
jgi:peptidoglycan/xylan/chitin deacetylase (PgdA/CDA1 family)